MREGVILVGSTLDDAHEYAKLIKADAVIYSQCFSAHASPSTFEGLRLKRVYLTPGATREMPDELRDFLTRNMAFTKDREGFFLVQENGELYGPTGRYDGDPEAV